MTTPHQPAITDAGAISLGVIICCYTTARRDLLGAAIDAAAAQLGTDDRLIVVADHNDELLGWVKSRVHDGARRVDVVPNAHLRGLSGARNTGLDCSDEDVLVFLDDDAVLAGDGLAAVRRAFADPSVVAVGGAVTPEWAGGTAPRWFPDEFGWVVGCDYRGIADDGADIRNPIGAAMAVRRSALAEIGGFATELGRVGDLPVGCEETLMGIELHRTFPRGRVIRDAGFGVAHSVSADRESTRYFLRRCLNEGKSKAVLSRMAGSGDALSAETSYVLRTISSGVLRYLCHVLRGDPAAAARLAMMIIGVAVTAAGTAWGTGAGARRRAAADSRLVPAQSRRRRASSIAPDDLVTVVIPTIGRDLLIDAVDAALAQDHPNIEVVVVDNRPGYGRVPVILADRHDRRLRIVNETFPGISAARNAGIHAARGRVVAFTDDDARPAADWVSTIVRAFTDDTTGSVGAVTGRVVGIDTPTELQELFEDAKVFDKGSDATIWALTPEPEHVAAGVAGPHNFFFPYTAGQLGSGNNFALDVEILSDTGNFDERLGTGTASNGGEDLDLMREIILSGWAIAYRPDAVVTHYHRDNMDDLRTQAYGYGTGMSASVTKLLFSRHAVAVAKRIPAGLWALLVPGSENTSAFSRAQWPAELRSLELRGYLAGPLLFGRGHLRCRGRRQQVTGPRTDHAS
ncbi:glycosyltransferase [Gordonia sp. VNQ95]|uniref:glycosyltransferase n=1 Tax=Gordonia sp. VNQ95 TaxID=3156619 RepID=UPI0032B5CE2B